ncbi:MAG: HAD hydrolase family protein [Myxococcales bacterium]|nr:HAD hydrolase family protein [Myxococcales bacterium]
MNTHTDGASPPPEIRYLVADVDDTLTVDGSLSGAVLTALQRARAAGIEVILNTGRPAGYGATLLAYVDGVSAVVVENGGAWFDRHAPGAPADPHEAPLFFRTATDPSLRTKLADLARRVADRAGLAFVETADNAFRLTDYTVLRRLPGDAAALLSALRRYTDEESAGQGALLASSIHVHFMLDGERPRSKADGVAQLLARRGIGNPAQILARHAVSVGDSANDASFFEPGCFAWSVGVRNIERYLPELGAKRPQHITREPEGRGFVELIDLLLEER